jgi:soluble lytic murein transglycosylase-like protein
LISEVAATTALPHDLLHAVIAVESGYQAGAVSHKGAQGMMQLLPATAKRFGVSDPFDPRQNVAAGGAAYLKWLLAKFDGILSLALAAYNAGEQAVVKAGCRIPPFSETRAYVPRVLERLRRNARY